MASTCPPLLVLRGPKQQEGSDQLNNHHIKMKGLYLPRGPPRGQQSINQQFGVTKLIPYNNNPYQSNIFLSKILTSLIISISRQKYR